MPWIYIKQSYNIHDLLEKWEEFQEFILLKVGIMWISYISNSTKRF